MSQSDNIPPSAKDNKSKKKPNPKSDVKIIYKKKYIENDHEEHIDERWLVSYSDMMTLLFGLFVMLYAMQDPEASKKMQESIKQKFADENDNNPPEQKISPEEMQNKIKQLMAQLDTQQSKINESEELKLKVLSLDEEAKKLKIDLEEKILENTKFDEELKKMTAENNEKNRSIASIETEKKSTATIAKEKKDIEDVLNKKLSELEKKDNDMLKLKEDLAKKVAQLDQLDKANIEKKDFKKEYLTEMEKAKALDVKNKELEAKINSIEQKGSFLAIVLNWTTGEHDLDLIIKDPNGKKFTFKNKQFSNYPGKMVLDSRRGPGAEIWQADKVIAGTYEAEITFYNQYGNVAPAEGKLVIFSTRGNVEIPDIKLDLGKNPTRKVSFEISKLGEIKLK